MCTIQEFSYNFFSNYTSCVEIDSTRGRTDCDAFYRGNNDVLGEPRSGINSSLFVLIDYQFKREGRRRIKK